VAADALLGLLPALGALLAGVVAGLFGAARAATLAVYRHRRLSSTAPAP